MMWGYDAGLWCRGYDGEWAMMWGLWCGGYDGERAMMGSGLWCGRYEGLWWKDYQKGLWWRGYSASFPKFHVFTVIFPTTRKFRRNSILLEFHTVGIPYRWNSYRWIPYRWNSMGTLRREQKIYLDQNEVKREVAATCTTEPEMWNFYITVFSRATKCSQWERAGNMEMWKCGNMERTEDVDAPLSNTIEKSNRLKRCHHFLCSDLKRWQL